MQPVTVNFTFTYIPIVCCIVVPVIAYILWVLIYVLLSKFFFNVFWR
jgi:hypothetical protein